MKISLLITAFVILLLFGCKSDSVSPSGNSASPKTNLIANPAFELCGTRSLTGWSNPDTAYVHYSSTRPPGNRLGFSLVINSADNGLLNSLRTYIPISPGHYTCRLSGWMKLGQKAEGRLNWMVYHPGGGHGRGLGWVGDTLWHYLSDEQEITLTSSDSLFVELEGGVYYRDSLPTGPTWFYHPNFVITDTSAILNTPHASAALTYPNN
jgi:hypothetical protein